VSPAVPVRELAAAAVLAAALRGGTCLVHGLWRSPGPLPVHGWQQEPSRSDRVLLAHCFGPTLDVGCGPGRMAAHLCRQGVPVLGIDVVPEAVAQTRDRGAVALVRDVFDAVPGEGRWRTVLLADGNIGIGGDPLRLLRRAASLVCPGGRVVADVAAPGVGLQTRQVHLSIDRGRSVTFPWAVVGADAIPALAAGAGFAVTVLDHHESRWYAVLTRTW